ncbi:MAG: head fiber protein [Collinsella sp.]|nr:head fiber protein [Collinsella sp.]
MDVPRDIVVSGPDGRDLGATTAYALDLSVGDTGNNFELAAPGMPISQGCLVSIDGTEYGGVVDSAELVGEGGSSTVTWSGRTWTGVLLGRVLAPDAGRDYLDVAGEANAVLSQLVSRMGLSGLFEVPAADSGVRVQHRFERFVDGYTGIRRMLAASSAKLVIRRVDGSTVLRAEPARTAGGGVDSDLIDFTAKRDWRPVNHLVCAGTGELASRKVVHLYADERGNVSRTQTLRGVDEVAELYDYSNADEAKLVEDGTKKLRAYQTGGTVDVTVRGGLDLDVGDTVTGEVRGGGVPDSTVTARVVKKVVKASGGLLSVSYEVGNPQTSATGGISGRAESSGGGASYAAGEGVTISGGVISADVTGGDLDAVRADAASARTDASNALAAVGGAEQSARDAMSAAAAAQATADGRLAPSSVVAESPLAASASGGTVTLSHGRVELSQDAIDRAVGLNDAPPGFGGSITVPALAIDALGHVIGAEDVAVRLPSSTATAGAAGLMSAADKAKLDGVAAGANRYTLPTASRYTLGGVRVDGSTISASNGVISVVPGAGGGGITALDSWPVGSIYQSTRPTNPAQLFGGTWAAVPSLGPYTWERIA